VVTDLSAVWEELEKARREALSFFERLLPEEPRGLPDLETLNRCVDLLADEERRKRFNGVVLKFGRLLNIVLPDPKALEEGVVDDFRRLSAIRQAAYVRYRDKRLSPRGYVPKLMKIVSEVIEVGDFKIPDEPVPLLSDAFVDYVELQTTEMGKAEALRWAIEEHIEAHHHEDPVFYDSLRERLRRLIEEFQRRAIEAEKFMREMWQLVEEIGGRRRKAEEKGLKEEELPFFNCLRTALEDGWEEEQILTLTEDVVEAVKEAIRRDWTENEAMVREVEKAIWDCLVLGHKVPRILGVEGTEELVKELLELAQQHFKR